MPGTCWLCLSLFFLARANFQESIEENKDTEVLKEKEKGRGPWDTEDLELCLHSKASSPVPGKLSCYRRRLHVEFIDFELYAERPVLMRIRNFVGKSALDGILKEVQPTDDGRWMDKEDPVVAPIFKRLQRVVRLNPEIQEDFRIAVYGGLESNGPHYDYLSPTERRLYDIETEAHYGEEGLELLGNRLATMLLSVKPADKGGATAFPKLRTVIRPDPGDLLLWFNADSNGDREDGSLHAGCPIEAGEKIAVVAFFRANFQDFLKCSTSHAGYEAHELLKSGD